MTPRTRWLLVTFALIGAAFASTSTWVHYRLLTDPSYVSACDINSTFNCSQAYLSRFGSVFGVPVAVGGVAWFVLVALIAALARPSSNDSSVPAASYVFVLATIGLASILRLAYASYVVLKVVCLLCLGTYVCVLGIFIVSAAASSFPLAHVPRRLIGDLRSIAVRPRLLVIALLYLGAAAAAVALFPREIQVKAAEAASLSPDEQARFEAAWAQQPRLDLAVAADGARVVIVKFNDWLCPTCKYFHYQYAPLLEQYAKSNPGAVKYVVKDFPLSPDCNPIMTSVKPDHRSACEAAAAVRMARDRGKADAMIEWLFSNQEHLVELNMAGSGGAEAIKSKVREMLGITDFDGEYARELPAIRQDVAEGMALKIDGTPAFFVNGVNTSSSGNLPPAYLDLAIRIELKK